MASFDSARFNVFLITCSKFKRDKNRVKNFIFNSAPCAQKFNYNSPIAEISENRESHFCIFQANIPPASSNRAG